MVLGGFVTVCSPSIDISDMLGFEDLVLDLLFKLLAGDEIHPVEIYTYSLN